MFVLNETNYYVLLKVDMFYLDKLLIYLIDESNHVPLTKIACKIFENNYVVEKIMYPLLDNLKLIHAVLRSIEEHQSYRVRKKSITIPKEFTCFRRLYKKTPAPPVNTPEESWPKIYKSRNPKKMPDISLPKKLETEFEKNRLQALWLLEEARKVPQRLVEPKREVEKLPPIAPKKFKANKIPTKKEIEIKGNLTTTLREAARLIKEQEDEIKKIDEMMKGGSNVEELEQMELELRKEEQQKEMEDIERKHLKSLLTYEEAILAKQKLLELNKQKTRECKGEKAELLEKLNKWRKEEQEKIKASVEKSQKIKQDAKESEKKLQEEKHNQVRLQQYETRELLKQAYEEHKKELARKMDLIQEIRTLHQIRANMNVKEFDPTECPNLGLLCEMSIAELQERLALTKIKINEELKEKRRRILKKKEEQQQMLENVKNFIAKTRQRSKPKSLPIPIVNLEQSPDLIELRQQLEEKRSMRMKATQLT